MPVAQWVAVVFSVATVVVNTASIWLLLASKKAA